MNGNDTHSLAHTVWNCKYHIVFAPKYRRKVFYGQRRYDIGQILRELCRWKGVNLLEAEACPDHIHMLISYPPNISVSSIVRRLKQCSTLSLWKQFSVMLAKQFWKEHTFWSDGYFVCSIGEANPDTIRKYIENQG